MYGNATNEGNTEGNNSTLCYIGKVNEDEFKLLLFNQHSEIPVGKHASTQKLMLSVTLKKVNLITKHASMVLRQ